MNIDWDARGVICHKVWVMVSRRAFCSHISIYLIWIYSHLFTYSLCFQVILFLHFTPQPNIYVFLLFPLGLPAMFYSLNTYLIFKLSGPFSVSLFPSVKKCITNIITVHAVWTPDLSYLEIISRPQLYFISRPIKAAKPDEWCITWRQDQLHWVMNPYPGANQSFNGEPNPERTYLKNYIF